ncbi:hypothetical protein NEPTK9_001685 [Candidatus Neptunochlamydia vexilliferae]|uniref:Uncharacterized protein n=1 Tax=Candidatus Neptunichlamydia vexilliferae TaxID=1651774 RepID=A0ABS0B188_9BACT|nr:hypothetical protein [Candidatus Neptunochlamydia vexilliferae]
MEPLKVVTKNYKPATNPQLEWIKKQIFGKRSEKIIYISLYHQSKALKRGNIKIYDVTKPFHPSTKSSKSRSPRKAAYMWALAEGRGLVGPIPVNSKKWQSFKLS